MSDTVDYSRKWYVMAAVATGLFLSTIDGSIVNVALPTLEQDLATQFAVVQWVVLAYLLTVTTLMLTVGRLADMIGKKPLYTTGFAIFTVGSALCGASPNIYWLIGFRVLQAIGAAMIMALGTAIITEAFPPSERGRALGIGGSMVSVGIVVGPTLGGLLLSVLSWHWIFFVNLPIGVVGIYMVTRFVPDFKPKGRQRFDLAGALTLFTSLICLLIGLTLGQLDGFGQWQTQVLLAAWALFLLAFIIIESRVPQPMIDLTIFRHGLFSINLITGFLSFVCIAGTTILMPFYLENVLQYDTRQVGLLLAVVPLTMGSIAPLAGAASDRFGTRPITVLGLFVLLIGYCAVSTLDQGTTALGYIARFLPLGLGMGIFQSPNNSTIMGTAPRHRLGVASGLLSLTRTLGQTVGIALLSTLWASRVISNSPDLISGNVTSAALAAQVSGLQDTFRVTALVIGAALLLSVWGLRQERRQATPPGTLWRAPDSPG